MRILVVEDSEPYRILLESILKAQKGWKVESVASGKRAIEAIDGGVDLLLLDLGLPDISGFEVIRRLKKQNSLPYTIVVTADSDPRHAVEAMRLGAHNFLHKPVDPEALILAAREAQESLREAGDFFVSRSSEMEDVYAKIDLVAKKKASVVIVGESGTGKELVAKRIHELSERAGEFVVVNCPAIVETLAEAELFGYVKGAFTGAARDQVGIIEQAQSGTLFIDEVADLSLEIQAKLLRVLQERKLQRLGDRSTREVDIRVLCASQTPLMRLVASGVFREDLAYRLMDIEISLPPLRQRVGDVAPLVEFFCQRYCSENKESSRAFSQEAIQFLETLPWPGNVRELRSIVRRALIMNPDQLILPHMLAYEARPAEGQPDTSPSLRSAERDLIRQTLEEQRYNVSRSAKVLKIGRSTLYRKMKKYGLTG